ncbi:MAG: hypothetical protein ACJ8EL_05720 [Rhizomicrobium sp.]
MAGDKGNPLKKSVSSAFGRMSGGDLVGSADQRTENDGASPFPILVHTDQGPVVFKSTEDCSGDYNAWTVQGDLPEPPFPTEDLFCNPNYTLQPIENMELTINGTDIHIDVDCGTVSGGAVNYTMAMLKWSEIGRR